MHLKPNPEDNGVITKQFLKKLCKSDFRQYYSTPQLNDILYLHYKGFEKIDNLEEYTGMIKLMLRTEGDLSIRERDKEDRESIKVSQSAMFVHTRKLDRLNFWSGYPKLAGQFEPNRQHDREGGRTQQIAKTIKFATEKKPYRYQWSRRRLRAT